MTVLDASAVLAFVYAEPGHELVKPVLDGGQISAANWSETLQKIAARGGNSDRQGVLLGAMGLTVEPLTAEDAAAAARLYPSTRSAGLSLGGRCCLALAIRLNTPALTADKAWNEIDLPIDIQLVR